MKHVNKIKVYYEEVDSYGVVWHGSYIKWLEIGRVELCSLLGIDFKVLDEKQILMPVVELNCRYKQSAKLFDELTIETSLKELTKLKIVFEHIIKRGETLILNAQTTVVSTGIDGKIHKKMDDYLVQNFKKAL